MNRPTVQAGHRDLRHVLACQVRVQRTGERERVAAMVEHAKHHREGPRPDEHLEHETRPVRPPGPGVGGDVERERRRTELGPGCRPGEAVLRQRALGGELRETHRDSTPDGRAAGNRGQLRYEQPLGSVRGPPRHHVSAVERHERGGTVGTVNGDEFTEIGNHGGSAFLVVVAVAVDRRRAAEVGVQHP